MMRHDLFLKHFPAINMVYARKTKFRKTEMNNAHILKICEINRKLLLITF